MYILNYYNKLLIYIFDNVIYTFRKITIKLNFLDIILIQQRDSCSSRDGLRLRERIRIEGEGEQANGIYIFIGS